MRSVAWRFALRELRSGVKGFRIFLACLALGVAAIAAAGSTAAAFRQGLAVQAREIMGGDLSVTVQQRPFSKKEEAVIERLGKVSWAAGARTMAEAASGERRLVELRGVAGAYPLYGEVGLRGAASLAEALTPRGGVAGAAVEQALIDRLGLKLGDTFTVGNSRVVATAVLLEEPDRLSRGFALGPRVLTSLQVLEAGGFLEPGLPHARTARIALAPDLDLRRVQQGLASRLDPGARVRNRFGAAQGVRRLIDQLEYFLGFIGLASLLAGGLGVSGAVGAFLEGRKSSIAVLKALGAEGPTVRNVYLIQIGVLAALGVAIGVAVGAAAPFVLSAFIPPDLPVPALFAVYPEPLIRAAGFGLMAAAAFSLAPLARARATSPASLFRQDLQGRLRLSVETVWAGMAFAGLAALAVVTAPTMGSALGMIVGTAVAFALLWLLGWGAAVAAARLRRLARGPLRIGLANLSGARSSAKTASPAIGLGVALLTAVLLIQSSLLNEVTVAAPRSAPALVFTEIPGERTAEFDRAVAAAFARPLTAENWLRLPVVSGRIVALNGQDVDKSKIASGERWAFDNDIQMSVIGDEPTASNIVAGQWWPANSETPQVALEVDAARGAGLKIGDSVTLSVLGREIEARIAVLRVVEFGGFGPTFAVIMNPVAMTGANLRHVAIAKATRDEEAAVLRALASDFSEVDVISVREQLEAAAGMFERLALAIRSAGAVALISGLLVLAGALAANANARTKEAAILKVIGASRGQILAAYGFEYGAVGLIAAITGIGLGAAAAWPVTAFVFKTSWAVDWTGVAALLAGAALATGAGGVIAALQALRRRPAPVLRGV